MLNEGDLSLSSQVRSFCANARDSAERNPEGTFIQNSTFKIQNYDGLRVPSLEVIILIILRKFFLRNLRVHLQEEIIVLLVQSLVVAYFHANG